MSLRFLKLPSVIVPAPHVKSTTYTAPHLITQQKLTNFVRDLNLLQSQSESLDTQLQKCKLLYVSVKVTSYRGCQCNF